MILIRLKEEEVTRLSRIRDDVESELQELTASLFQEYLHYYFFIDPFFDDLDLWTPWFNKTGIYPLIFISQSLRTIQPLNQLSYLFRGSFT